MTESVIIEEELPPDAADMYRRLIFLREEYRRQTHAILGTNSDASGDKKNRKENDENDKRVMGKKVGSEDYQIRAITKSVIECHGGSSHLETIVEYVHMRLPNLRKRDGSPFTTLDCKKHVQTNLRTDINSRSPTFQKDPKQFGCWVLVNDENDINNKKNSVDPLFNFLSQTIDNSPSKCCKIKTLTEQVIKSWLPKLNSKGVELSGDEAKEAVRIILETNPRFKKDGESQGYLHVPQKRRRIMKNGDASTPSKRRKADSDSDEDGSTGKNSLHTPKAQKTGKSIFIIPPSGTICKCGEKAPMKSSSSVKWKKSTNGSLLCPSCYHHPSSIPSSSASAAVAASASSTNSHTTSNGHTEIEDTNPWIRCDDCHKWVRAKSDNIDDISLYDDSNPNHLDYYCPKCRKKREEAQKNPPSRHSKRTRRTSHNSSSSTANSNSSTIVSSASAPSTPEHPSTPKNELKKSRNLEKKKKTRGERREVKAERENGREEEEEEEEIGSRKPKRSSRSLSSSPDVKSQKESEEEEDGEIQSDESAPQSPEDGSYGHSRSTKNNSKQNTESKRKYKKENNSNNITNSNSNNNSNKKNNKEGEQFEEMEIEEENDIEEDENEHENDVDGEQNENENESEKDPDSSPDSGGSSSSSSSGSVGGTGNQISENSQD